MPSALTAAITCVAFLLMVSMAVVALGESARTPTLIRATSGTYSAAPVAMTLISCGMCIIGGICIGIVGCPSAFDDTSKSTTLIPASIVHGFDIGSLLNGPKGPLLH